MLRTASRPLGGLVRPAKPSSIIFRNYAANVGAYRKQARQQMIEAEKDMSNKSKVTRDQVRAHMSFLPGFFIPMPLANVPKAPKQFFTYQFYRVKTQVLDYLAILSLRWQSKKTMFTKAALGINRGKALAAGKALHSRLGQAMAAGDRGELRLIAMPRLYESLAATLDKRDKHVRATWEIITNHGARLVAHRCALLPPPFPANMVVEQAVIAIDTTQKLERYDNRTNALIPGSTKVQRRTEYVGIHRSWNKKTNESDAWSVLGNTKATTLEEYKEWLFYEEQQSQDNVNKKLKQAREGTL